MNIETMLDGSNVHYIEQMYESYLQDPQSISEDWLHYFEALPALNNGKPESRHAPIRDRFRNWDMRAGANADNDSLLHQQKQVRVLQLINAYRFLGHFLAKTNPLDELGSGSGARSGMRVGRDVPELTLAYHELSEADLDTTFNTGSLVNAERMKLCDIINQLDKTYCYHIGAQYMHITNTERKRWIQQRLESVASTPGFSKEERLNILRELTAAEGLERYLHTKYVGQKRFSLEGGESLIPMMSALIQYGGELGVKEAVIGMAHRGRLNVLVNILGKAPGVLFDEFEGRASHGKRTGDVKYHMGFSSDVRTKGGDVHIALAFNPSHLEIVGPVVEGSVRARQDRWADNGAKKVLPIVLHGDAAFAGQGVNMEMLNMAETRGYRTHGTVHIVVNNQIGFTTSASIDARSTYYCTDVAKMVNAPIFHVNGDDPEAVVLVTKVAMEYRTQFKKDVVIDLVCYRRHGHNEADEPAATQPVMYKKIRSLPTTRELHIQRLVAEGVVSEDDAQNMMKHYRQKLADGKPTVPFLLKRDEAVNPYPVDWKRFMGNRWDRACDTTIDAEKVRYLGERIATKPDDFKLHSRVNKIVNSRLKMAAGEQAMDWGFCENLAYATLVEEGYPVRLAGEDCGRGTFFHRHAVLHEQMTGETYVPLKNISPDQVDFTVIDSLLSEEAVLAFEYGYATAEANTLVIWEAQFGDFANCAQVVIDQFISSGEQKWGRYCGLAMFLPHGFEGQGPEHSSARLERYLQLCAQDNMQVCVPSTPAQVFHMIRRQMVRDYRTPLIVMTPKSLLRHPQAVSTAEDLTECGFQNVIDEIDALDKDRVTRLVLCSGKVYYDLLNKRREENLNHVAIVRVEQLYPFPHQEFATIMKQYPNVKGYIWCQEEPQNQGAWLSIQPELRLALGASVRLEYAGRTATAAPAVGSPKVHAQQQQALVAKALGL